MTELHELKTHIDKQVEELKVDLKTNNELVHRMGERINQLEKDEARRKGIESVINGTPVNWTKITMTIAGIATTAIVAAFALAQALLTGRG